MLDLVWVKFDEENYYASVLVQEGNLNELAIVHLHPVTIQVETYNLPPYPTLADRPEWNCRVMLGGKIQVSDPGWSRMRCAVCDGSPLWDIQEEAVRIIHQLSGELRKERQALRKAQLKAKF